MKSWLSLGLCAVILVMAGCSNDSKKDKGTGSEVQCTESTCKDSIILNYCEDGVITEKECPFGCIGNSCVPDRCTDNACKDSSTLLACEDGRLKTVHCPNGCEKNACKEKSEPEDPKTDEKCTGGEKSCARDRITQCVNGEWEVSWVSCPGQCEKGECTGDPCNEGDKKCDENNQMVCEDGVWHLTECPNGCDGGECKDDDASCTDGDKKCEDNAAMICEGGEWKTTPCDDNCVAGECVGLCEDGDTKCNNDELLTCKEGTWDATSCPNGCEDNKCRTCVEGKKMCQDNAALVCLEDKWQSTACENFCKDGECRNCAEGATGCVGNYYLTCIDNAWAATACSLICQAGEGCLDGKGEETDTCNSGTRACVGEELVTCSDGKWTSEYCSGGCENNKCKACTDGERRCELGGEDNTSAYLNVCEKGQWHFDKSCPGGCENDVCKECVDGQKECYMGNARECKNSTWETTTCEFNCKDAACRTCAEGTKECVGNELKTCTDNVLNSQTCEFGCENNACRKCVENEKQCSSDNRHVQICKNNNLSYSGETCPLGCSNAACITCTQNETRCNGKKLETCTGKDWKTTRTCEYGCENGACRNCTENAMRCSGTKIQKCIGNTWTDHQNCGDEGKVCFNNQCLECAIGAQQCVGEGSKYKECTSSGWEEKTCENSLVCVDKDGSIACKTPCSTPGKEIVNCVTYFSSTRTCEDTSPNYTYSDSEYEDCFGSCTKGVGCDDGTNHPCTDGQKACGMNGQSYECKDGSWKSPKPCAEGCNEETGECIHSGCESESLKCEDNKVLKCNDSGEWLVKEYCSSRETCQDGACICKEGATDCISGNFHACKNGLWEEIDKCTGTCDDDEGCINECESGKKYCEGNRQVICVDGSYIKITCHYGCDDGVCNTEVECEDNDPPMCSGNTLVYCSGGQRQTRACEKNEVCREGECVSDGTAN